MTTRLRLAWPSSPGVDSIATSRTSWPVISNSPSRTRRPRDAILRPHGVKRCASWVACRAPESCIGTPPRPPGIGPDVRQRLSRTLVLVQVALSLVLLIGAGLLVRTICNPGKVDLGFRPERVLMFNVSHNLRRETFPAAVARVAQAVHDRIRQIPGVESASLSTIPLFSGTDLSAPLKIPDNPSVPDAPVDARYNAVSSGYLETL
jgi:hypothetical protein